MLKMRLHRFHLYRPEQWHSKDKLTCRCFIVINEVKLKVRSFEYAGKYILIEGEKSDGEKVILKILREDFDWINGKIKD